MVPTVRFSRYTAPVAGRKGNDTPPLTRAQLDRIRRVHHDDRDRCGRTLRGKYGGRMGRDDDVDLETHELQRELLSPLGPSLRVLNIEDDILALDVAEAA